MYQATECKAKVVYKELPFVDEHQFFYECFKSMSTDIEKHGLGLYPYRSRNVWL